MTKATRTTTRTHQTGATTPTVESRETCHADRWGRLIGGLVQTWEVDYADVPDAKLSDRPYYPAAGHYFAACPHSMRGGERYGASQSDVLFTAADAELLARRAAKASA